MGELILIVHDVRSALNVGSLLRTADGLGISRVVLSGYTPYPVSNQDSRLPHISQRAHAKIHKTALGAEKSVVWEHVEMIEEFLERLKKEGFQIAALEQAPNSINLNDYRPPVKLALIVGSEVSGLNEELLAKSDVVLEIPMRGRKESFNVAAAAAMAMYHLTGLDKSTA